MKKNNLPRYVYPQRTRHGKTNYYFRRHGKKTRVYPDQDSFVDEYNRLLAGNIAPPKAKASKHSLDWLIDQYCVSGAFLHYKPATRKQRQNIFSHVKDKAGSYNYASITRKHIVAGREQRKHTPFQAKNYLAAMRGLFQWAVESQLLDHDPTTGVKDPKKPKTKGFEPWEQWEIDAYRKRWPLGTHQRIWLEVVAATGARRGDAVRLGKQHIKDGKMAIETMKKGVWAYPPVLPELVEAIKHGPCGDLIFIVGKTGKPLTKESFGNMFRTACNEAGVKKSAHGLRKTATERYAELGLSDAELEAIFGWRPGSKMAAHYRQEANRARIANDAAERILNKKVAHPEV